MPLTQAGLAQDWENNLALVYAKQGQYEKAAEILRQLVRDHPRDPEYGSNLAAAIFTCNASTRRVRSSATCRRKNRILDIMIRSPVCSVCSCLY